jgi:hypothetical protein
MDKFLGELIFWQLIDGTPLQVSDFYQERESGRWVVRFAPAGEAPPRLSDDNDYCPHGKLFCPVCDPDLRWSDVRQRVEKQLRGGRNENA